MSRILITGVNGFIGQHLSKLLLQANHLVAGIDIFDDSLNSKIIFFKCDLCDENTLTEILQIVNPEYIYHLAGLLRGVSIKEMHNTNVTGTINLFNSIITACDVLPKVLVSGSSAIYGENNSKIIDESSFWITSEDEGNGFPRLFKFKIN